MSTSNDTEGRAPRSIWDYWRICWEGKWIILGVLAVTTGIALVGTLQFPDRYRAETLVELTLSQPAVLGSMVERSNSISILEQDRAFKTEFVRVRTRKMLARAIEEHDLMSVLPELGGMEDPIAFLRRHVDLEKVPKTNVANLSAWWWDPDKAAAIANAVAETYVASDLQDRIRGHEEKWKRLQGSVTDKTLARRISLQLEIDTLASRPSIEAVRALPSFAEDDALSKLTEDLQAAERAVQARSGELGPNAPEMRQLQRERDTVRQQFNSLIKARQKELEQELAALGGRVDGDVAPAASGQSEVDRNFELELRNKITEQQVLASLAEPKAKIIDAARPPKFPYAPNMLLNVALAIVVGLGFGGGLVFFRDYLDVSVKTLDDVETDLGLNLLAVVPTYGDEPTPVVREAFQTLRTGLLFASAARKDRVLLVASAGPQEGKTNTVGQLARSIAASGERVIVVDCDLRKPSVARHFQVPGAHGLTSYLVDRSGELGWQQLAAKVSDTLSVLPSGPIPPNPIDLLRTPKFRELLDELKAHHDWVLLDSPPISSVSDSVVLANLAEMAVIVLRHDHTDKEVARRAIQRLRGVDVAVVGAVLTDVDMGKSYNREYYYGRFFYGHYYADGGADRGKEGGRDAREKRSAG